MRIFIVGAGITGGLLAQLLIRAGHDVRCGARNVSRARRFAGRKVSIFRIDARRAQSIVGAARGSELIVNASLAKYNGAVLRAALTLGTHYLDLASHMERSPFMPEQLALHAEFLGRRRTAVINAGVAPGLTNLLVRGSSELLDEVETVRIRLFEDTESDEPVSTWSADVCFDEALAMPILYRGGRFRRGRRFGELEVFEFAAPIGRRRCVLAAQDEVGTLPRYVPLRELDVKIAGRDMEQIRNWHRQHRLRAGRPPHRSRFPPTPSTSELATLMRHGVLHEARFALAILVNGTRKGEAATIRSDASFPSLRQLAARGLFTTPIAYATAVLAAAFATHLPVRHHGVFPPEALPPAARRAVLSGLRKRGIVIRRTIEPAD